VLKEHVPHVQFIKVVYLTKFSPLSGLDKEGVKGTVLRVQFQGGDLQHLSHNFLNRIGTEIKQIKMQYFTGYFCKIIPKYIRCDVQMHYFGYRKKNFDTARMFQQLRSYTAC
jgi:hypothetical protein